MACLAFRLALCIPYTSENYELKPLSQLEPTEELTFCYEAMKSRACRRVQAKAINRTLRIYFQFWNCKIR